MIASALFSAEQCVPAADALPSSVTRRDPSPWTDLPQRKHVLGVQVQQQRVEYDVVAAGADRNVTSSDPPVLASRRRRKCSQGPPA
jgi:hypothetical protein